MPCRCSPERLRRPCRMVDLIIMKMNFPHHAPCAEDCAASILSEDFDIDKKLAFSILRSPSKPSERWAALSAALSGWKVRGGVPEWLKGTGCKPVGYAYVGSNPTPTTKAPW